MSVVRPQRPLPNDVIGAITCTGQLNWFPDPEDLECVEQCGEVNAIKFSHYVAFPKIDHSGNIARVVLGLKFVFDYNLVQSLYNIC